jgi:hypothetical protein
MIAAARKRLAKSLSIRTRIASALITAVLATAGTPSAAAEATAEERAACTPDVFRLCASEIPNVSRIVSCMQRQRSKLSPACAAVFKPHTAERAAR